MNSDLTITQAKSEDAEPLAAIMTGWIHETPWMPKLHSAAGDVRFLQRLIDTTIVLAARQGSSLCGFLSLEGNEIPALYISTAARGRGIGRVLLDEAKNDVLSLSLWTFQGNTGARRFYAREGFREVKLTDGQSNDEKLPDVRCVWERPEAACD